MFFMQDQAHRSARTTISNSGIPYRTPVKAPVPDHLIEKALESLHPEEHQHLQDVVKSKGRVLFIRNDYGSYEGCWNDDRKQMELVVSPKGRIKPGTITHETTHFHQCRQRRLSLGDGDRVKWEGKWYRLSNSGLKYFFQPWEQEAFRAECQLLSRQGLRIPTVVWFALKFLTYILGERADRVAESHWFPLLFWVGMVVILGGLGSLIHPWVGVGLVGLLHCTSVPWRVLKVQASRLRKGRIKPCNG